MTRLEKGGLERRTHDAELEDVLVEPDVDLRVGGDGRVGDALRLSHAHRQHRGAYARARPASPRNHRAAAARGAAARGLLLQLEQLPLRLRELGDARRLTPLQPADLVGAGALGRLELGRERRAQLRLVLEQELRLLELLDELVVLQQDALHLLLGEWREAKRLQVGVHQAQAVSARLLAFCRRAAHHLEGALDLLRRHARVACEERELALEPLDLLALLAEGCGGHVLGTARLLALRLHER